MEFHYAPGATPLDPDEAAGLVPTHITTQGDLNAWEQVNIAQGGSLGRAPEKTGPTGRGVHSRTASQDV